MNINFKYRLWRRTVRYFWQRCTRGWDNSELWSLDHSLAKHILPRLKEFQRCHAGCPMGSSTEEWNDILQKMIVGFEYYASGECWGDYNFEKAEAAQHGLELFAKWYGNLWS